MPAAHIPGAICVAWNPAVSKWDRAAPLKSILRSHLAKGAASRIFWETFEPTLARTLSTPEQFIELTALYDSLDGKTYRRDRISAAVRIFRLHHNLLFPLDDMIPQKDLQSDFEAWNKAFPPPQPQPSARYSFLSESKVKAGGRIKEEHRKWLEKNVNDIASARNEYKVTATELAIFLESEQQASSPDYAHYAALYLKTFGFSYEDVEKQSSANQNAILQDLAGSGSLGKDQGC
ncbi:hypothetical protein BDP27DRAFT_1403866 [Rhodocollybia butyracea]|uniref:Uncharacterized protein n=1 Tax=Rhodocollybia butyracea TaxID=206335 RepID=A0A9P5PPY6_9AGAR|nr:hypothetical protein BDP27DRAFT_1403866 [Rhodocollybia butyracea]